MKTTRYVLSFDIGENRFYFVSKSYHDYSKNINDAFLFKKASASNPQFNNILSQINAAIEDSRTCSPYSYLREFKNDNEEYNMKDATNVRIRKVSVVVELDESEE